MSDIEQIMRALKRVDDELAEVKLRIPELAPAPPRTVPPRTVPPRTVPPRTVPDRWPPSRIVEDGEILVREFERALADKTRADAALRAAITLVRVTMDRGAQAGFAHAVWPYLKNRPRYMHQRYEEL